LPFVEKISRQPYVYYDYYTMNDIIQASVNDAGKTSKKLFADFLYIVVYCFNNVFLVSTPSSDVNKLQPIEFTSDEMYFEVQGILFPGQFLEFQVSI